MEILVLMCGFNPRAREGRDFAPANRRVDLIVSIRAPARDATQRATICRLALLFQSARPRGTRPASFSLYSASEMFQSARPRGTRPLLREKGVLPPRVSIRAPARDATRRCRRQDLQQLVSIRAPARDATQADEGRRASLRVSIRAPARDATSLGQIRCTSSMFQSARPRGTRRRHPATRARCQCFNPRAREGRDTAASRRLARS